MKWSSVRRWLERRPHTRRGRNHRRQPPHLEVLEDRWLPSGTSLLGLDAAHSGTTPDAAAQTRVAGAYGQLPLAFEINQGQTDAQVQFFTRGSGYALFLTSSGAVLSLKRGSGAAPLAVSRPLDADLAIPPAPPANVTGVALAMNLVGANPQAPVRGLDQLPGTTNYFIGNDPSLWHTNIANFGGVEYQNVYPGVNLVYHGNQRQLEYDFVVAPGADPGPIRLKFDGANSIGLDDQGNLVLHAASGDVLQHAPVVYQEAGGTRQAVAGHFVLLGLDQVGFQVGAYDLSLPLTIDPVLSYSTYLAGQVGEQGNGIAVDSSGNAYVTGFTWSSNFPTTAGAFQTSHASDGGTLDAFVTKLNPAGTALIYSTYLGGNGQDQGLGIALDSTGNAYVTGFTLSSNFPTTAGAFQTSPAGGGDVFVTKLNATGTALTYSTYLGGTGLDVGYGIAVDSTGNAYVTGDTESEPFNFPTTAGAFKTSFQGGVYDAFVTKLNAAGTALGYSTYLGGNSDDHGYGIAVDGAGNAYVAGVTESTNFPTTAGAFQTSLAGAGDAFVTKLNAAGTALSYSTYLGGNAGAQGQGIAVDSSGNAYVTGFTNSTNFPTTAGAFQSSFGGGASDAFVTKLNAAGAALAYSTYLGGNGQDEGLGIAVDSSGNANVSGRTDSTNFPTMAGAFQISYGGGTDAFGTKLNAAGTALNYSTYLGGNLAEYGNSIAVDVAGNAYVTGVTSSTNFPTTAGAFQTSYGGSEAAFVTKLGPPNPASSTTVSSSANPSVFGQSVTFTALVTPTSGSGTPSGTVQFVIDGGNFGSTVTLSGGSATISNAALSVGTHTVTANYSGDSNFTASSGSLAGGQTVNKASSSTTVSSSVNPSVFGQNVTFTATVSAVSPGAGTPGGTVQFLIDGSNFGGTVTLAGASATISDAALSVGTHTVTASYSGNGSFTTSTGSLSGGQTVNKASSSTVVSSSLNPSVFGQTVTFTATVSAVSPGAGTAGGTVQFLIDGSNFGGAVTLAGASATISDAALSVGTHTVTASYGGSSSFTISNGSLASGQTVNKASSSTVVSSSLNPSVFGQTVTFTATVSAVSPGAGTAGGTVQFLIDGSNFGGAVTLAGASATISDAALSVGTHTVTASYSGNGSFTTSTGSLSGGQTVNKASSSTVVSSSLNPSVFGQTVTFTATVSAVSPGAGTAGGTVQFLIDGSNFGSAVTLAGASATISDAALSVGTHTVTASYSGNGSFTTSTGSLSGGQTVNKASSSTVVSSSLNPSVFGQTVTFTATVSAVSPGAGTAGGTVQFVIDGTNFGSAVTLAGGSASVSDAALSRGTHTMTANYSGDSNFTTSSGTLAGGQTVKKASSSTTVSSSLNPAVFTQSVTFTATVSAVSPGAGTPGGTVQFLIDGSNYGSALTLSGGSATISAASLSVGTHVVTASYGGDANFSSSSGTLAGGQTVQPGPHFVVSAPGTATTGSAISVTVTAKDVNNNIATGYTGTVQLTSTDGAASFPVNNYTFTTGPGQDNGVHTFNVTLNTAGTQKITAFDSTNVVIGVSGPIVTRGLVVTSLTPTPTGFVATFSKPFDPSKMNVYDITLTGVTNPSFKIPGSVLLGNNNQTLTFVATNLELPDDTYNLDLTSGANAAPPSGGAKGFQEVSGVPLDGANNAGSADYTTTFTTSYNAALAVLVPSFARGPGQAVNVVFSTASNAYVNGGSGLPVQLADNSASASFTATSVSFTMGYNANWLAISNVSNVASPAGGTYSVSTAGSGANATATFTYTNSGGITLNPTDLRTVGQFTALVPSTAAYKSKGLLNLGIPTVQNGASPVPAVGQNGVDAVAFLGDASGDGVYSPLDANLLATVEVVQLNGGNMVFATFPLADPDLIGAVDGAIDPNSISQVLAINLNRVVPGIPAYTGAPSNNPPGPDPALAVGSGQWAVGSGLVTVPVNIDDPHPAGSTGLMEATLALTYDPRVFSVSPQDIHLGTVPRAGTGWILAAPVVDASKGQIGITLYSLTPISADTAGSLVTLDFRVLAGATAAANPIQLVADVNVGGQEIQTALADSQGLLTLHQAPGAGFVPGLDGEIVVTATYSGPAGATGPATTSRPTAAAETAGPIPQSAAGDDSNEPEALLAAVPGASAGLLALVALPVSTEGLNGTGEAAFGTRVLPPLTTLGPSPQRLAEQVFAEQAPLGHGSTRLWVPHDTDVDWLSEQNQVLLFLQGPDQTPGSARPTADPSDVDAAAWDAYFSQGGAELD